MKKIFTFSNIIVLGIFLLAFLMLIISAKMDSQTTDEGIHIFAGYTYLTRNDFRLDPEHPPILKELAALPILFFQNLKAPLDGAWDKTGNFYYDGWQEARSLGENFLYTLGNEADKIIFWGRLTFILLSLILGGAAYFWAKNLYDKKAGIFAAFLILFLPNILAHGRLINTDLGLTLFIFLGVFFWGKFLKSASWRTNWLNFLSSGIFFGLAFSSKFTSVLLVPILLVITLGKLFFFDKNRTSWRRYFLGLVGALIIGFIIVWASYGFSIQVPSAPPSSISEDIKLWTSFEVPRNFDNFINKAKPLMFPANYYKGLYLVGRHSIAGHYSYLWGQSSSSGWWYYFPMAIFYKTPIPIFIFLILTIIFYKKIRAKNNFDEFLVVAPPIIFLGLSMFSHADLGVRHVLPIFPFLIVFASKSINLVDFRSIPAIGWSAFGGKIIKTHNEKLIPALGFLFLILWYLYSAVASYPNFLTYFNEFASGSKNGYKLLNDSNLDWGQDIYRIKKYLDDHNIKDVYVFYPWDGDSSLKYYGINFQPMSFKEGDQKGYAVVSATWLEIQDLQWLYKYPHEQITPGVFIFDLR